MTNIVLLDTCIIHDSRKIKEKYPQIINGDSRFAISPITFYELYQKNLKLPLNKLEQYNIPFLILNFIELIALEDIHGGEILDKEILLSKFSEINVSLHEAEDIVKKEIKEHYQDKREFLKSIPEGKGNTLITFENISKKYQVLINNMRNGNFDKQTLLSMKLQEMSNKIYNKEQELAGYYTFKVFIKIEAFFILFREIGKRRSNGSNSDLEKECINLKFEKRGKTIPINMNSFFDIKLSVPYLPYIEKFITGDKYLSSLLKQLFPEYNNKIYLFDKNTHLLTNE